MTLWSVFFPPYKIVWIVFQGLRRTPAGEARKHQVTRYYRRQHYPAVVVKCSEGCRAVSANGHDADRQDNTGDALGGAYIGEFVLNQNCFRV